MLERILMMILSSMGDEWLVKLLRQVLKRAEAYVKETDNEIDNLMYKIVRDALDDVVAEDSGK